MKFKYSSFRKIWIENSLEQELRLQIKENAAALKHGIRNPETETETETEYGIRERRFRSKRST